PPGPRPGRGFPRPPRGPHALYLAISHDPWPWARRGTPPAAPDSAGNRRGNGGVGVGGSCRNSPRKHAQASTALDIPDRSSSAKERSMAELKSAANANEISRDRLAEL